MQDYQVRRREADGHRRRLRLWAATLVVLGLPILAPAAAANPPAPAPTLSINDVTLAEGDAGLTTFTFTITRSGDTTITSSVDWSTADGSAVASDDYHVGGPAVVTFAPAETTKTVTVSVVGDTAPEANDGFTVNLTNPIQAAIGDGTGVGRITNDDSATFSVNDATIVEADGAVTALNFTITRSGDTGGLASVVWRTLDAHATAGADYVAVAPTTINFGSAETSKIVSVTVNDDGVPEPTEDFYVRLSSPVGGSIADGSGLGTITDDDNAPPPDLLSISDATVVEGDSGTTLASFTVTRTGPSAGPASVQWFTVSNTAAAPGDYTAVAPTTLSFGPGETIRNVSVSVAGDTAVEVNETFLVRLATPVGAVLADGSGLGRITDDDAAALSVNDVTKAEGNTGTTSFTFTVTRSGDLGGQATVLWSTANGTATAASGDYVAVSPTTLTFAPAETAKPVTVTVNGNTVKEANETFQVRLTSPVGASIADGSGLGRITNDD